MTKKIERLEDLTPDGENFNKHTEFGTKLLEDSLRKFGAGRSILVDKDGNIIAGNSTTETAAAIGMEDVIVVPTDGKKLVVVQRTDLSLDSPEGRELALADNMTALKGIDLDLAKVQEKLGDDLAKAWGIDDYHDDTEKKCLCDLVEDERIRSYGDITVHSSFKKSKHGKALADIKEDQENIKLFAHAFIPFAKKIIGFNDINGWCLITAPKRRHKEGNFAEAVCKEISSSIGLRFYPDVFSCQNRTRILPTFTMEYEIEENNIVVYDDIITTGSTIRAMVDILRKKRKNVLCFAGILND